MGSRGQTGAEVWREPVAAPRKLWERLALGRAEQRVLAFLPPAREMRLTCWGACVVCWSGRTLWGEGGEGGGCPSVPCLLCPVFRGATGQPGWRVRQVWV